MHQIENCSESQRYESPYRYSNAPVAWIDELMSDVGHSVGPEDSFSRLTRTGQMVQDGLMQGLTDSYKDMPRTAADFTIKAGTAAVSGLSLATVGGLMATTEGSMFAPELLSLAGMYATFGYVNHDNDRVGRIWHASTDYWNNPHNYRIDRNIVAREAPVVLDTAACIWGYGLGAGLGVPVRHFFWRHHDHYLKQREIEAELRALKALHNAPHCRRWYY